MALKFLRTKHHSDTETAFPFVVYIPDDRLTEGWDWDLNEWAASEEPTGHWSYSRHYVKRKTVGYWFRFEDERTAFLFKMKFG